MILHAAWKRILVCALFCTACERNTEPPPEGGGVAVDDGTPAELARMVNRMMPALERLSGLDRIEPLRVRTQSREGARDFMIQRLAEEMPDAELDAVRRSYVALGLIPDTMDIRALLLDLYTEQVLGYYDPQSTTLYLVEGHGRDEVQSVVAHELVHALQDQHTSLDSLIARERGNDAQTAAHAAMEGHALLVMFAFMAEQRTGRIVDPAALPNPADQLAGALDPQNSEFPVFRRAPLIIRETLLFPYVSGAGFVHALWASMRPRERYPAPLDSLLPQSTEQVLRPAERFIARRDEPVAIDSFAAPAGWSLLHTDGMGQLETAIFLHQHLGVSARTFANGWAGDRYALFSNGDVDILEWRSVWDGEPEADRFAAAVTRAARARAGRHVSVERLAIGGRPGVRIVDAPAGAMLSAPGAP